ncbi:hypothetical protein IGB42_02343 [Andreprevotia sp. IGB-42]|uniref:hypothetical protein n=1 Tax=Andreprevotia sp. IGB-42 TaxID=2497473 RepID=UPI001356DBEE|nr:hypothetical protein [Andreprevotia sp. IGB-42]KAF0812949.1 hypothetical protein IGB42_02343 [Andreprevotia sp. IGB-42]
MSGERVCYLLQGDLPMDLRGFLEKAGLDGFSIQSNGGDTVVWPEDGTEIDRAKLQAALPSIRLVGSAIVKPIEK